MVSSHGVRGTDLEMSRFRRYINRITKAAFIAAPGMLFALAQSTVRAAGDDGAQIAATAAPQPNTMLEIACGCLALAAIVRLRRKTEE